MRLAPWLLLLLGIGSFVLGCPPPSKLCDKDSDCAPLFRCAEGSCRCADGLAACGRTCVDLLQDGQHCGACGKVCPSPTTCQTGQCLCPDASPLCDGACRDLASDPKHCGACGKACLSGEGCDRGRCFSSCLAGQTECSGRCTSLDLDPEHCGACGKTCLSGERCAFGTCLTSCPLSVPETCFGACVDTRADPRHCGACGQTCKPDQICQDGLCLCPQGRLSCGDRCIDPRSTSAHCGSCGLACPQGQVCAEGLCLASCPQETNDLCLGGCFDLQRSTDHCGACGQTCAPGQICDQGRCLCPQGLLLCEGLCIDPSSHPRHCGSCGKTCSPGHLCSQGSCQTSCPPQTPDPCYGGCVSLQSSPSHCGRCGRICRSDQRCNNGACLCPSDRTLCGESCTDLKSDFDHCGGCGKRCKIGESCQGGLCKQACPPGQIECKSTCIDPKIHPQHCGACDQACDTEQACIQGLCSCAPGRQLCGGRCLDVLYASDHCGRCNQACTPGQRCSKGRCVCAPGGCPWVLQTQTEPGQRSHFSALLEASLPSDPKNPQGPSQTVFFLLGLYTAQTSYTIGSFSLPPSPSGRMNLFLAQVTPSGSVLSAEILGNLLSSTDLILLRSTLVWDRNERALYAFLNFKGEMQLLRGPLPPLDLKAGGPAKESSVLLRWDISPTSLVWAVSFLPDTNPVSLVRGLSLHLEHDLLFISGAKAGNVALSSGACALPSWIETQAFFGSFAKDGTCRFLHSSVGLLGNAAEAIGFRPSSQGHYTLLLRSKGEIAFSIQGQTFSLGKPLPYEGLSVARLSASFSLLWKSEWEQFFTDSLIGGITEDPSGNLYLAGLFIKPLKTPQGTTYTPQGDTDAIVASLDSQGQTRWASVGTGSGGEFVAGLKFDPSGDLRLLLGATRASTWGSLSPTPDSYATIGGYRGRLSSQGQWLQADYLLTFLGSFAPSGFLLRDNGAFCVAGSLVKSFLSTPFFLQTQGDVPFYLYSQGDHDASIACTQP